MTLKFGKNSREIRFYQEKRADLEAWRRKFYEIDECLNEIIIQNNKIFEDNKYMTNEIEKQKSIHKQRRRTSNQ